MPGESLGQKSLEGYSPWGHRVRESHTAEWLAHTHPESRKMGRMDLFAGQEWRHRCREQTCGHGGERRGWDEVRAQH